jgi:hypothetical protein
MAMGLPHYRDVTMGLAEPAAYLKNASNNKVYQLRVICWWSGFFNRKCVRFNSAL